MRPCLLKFSCPDGRMCSAGPSTGLSLEAETSLYIRGAQLNEVADVVEGTVSHFGPWAATSAITIIAQVVHTALPERTPRGGYGMGSLPCQLVRIDTGWAGVLWNDRSARHVQQGFPHNEHHHMVWSGRHCMGRLSAMDQVDMKAGVYYVLSKSIAREVLPFWGSYCDKTGHSSPG